MFLTTLERFTIPTLLPETGNFTNLGLIRKTREALSFSDEELEALKIEEVDMPDGKTGSRWQEIPEKDVQIGKHVTGIIYAKLVEMNDKEELTPNMETLYEKFVAEEVPEPETAEGPALVSD